ncbi:type 4a pilus biogenesis protein PilO [Planctomycetota bacterium]
MNTDKKKNNEKQLAIIAIIVIFGGFIFTTIIKPQLSLRALNLEHMHQLQLKSTKIQRDLLSKNRVDIIYSQVEPLLISSGNDQQEISQLTRELNDLYSRLSLKIRSIKILPIDSGQFYKRLSIKIEMFGNIKDILKFILAVETDPNPIRIERFDLKPREIADNVQVSFVISKIVAESKVRSH